MSVVGTGVVLCECGGQIISNSGKIRFDFKMKSPHYLRCWRCDEQYDCDYVYSKRIDKLVITITNEMMLKDKIKNILK